MSLSRISHHTVETEVKTERIVYTWLLKKFDLLPQDINEELCSPWFYQRNVPCSVPDKWRLELYPRGERDDTSTNSNCIALYLARESSGESSITIHREMEISKSGRVLVKRRSTTTYGPQASWGYPTFLERSKIVSKNSSDDHQITITCIIDIPAEVVSTTSLDTPIIESKKNQLSDDFRVLFEDPVFSDFTIIVGDQKFSTHRNILAKRSSVFAAMFEHKDLEENLKKEVKIENIKPDVVNGMLEFIYTDQVTNLKELANGLLEVADKYDLEKLRNMCEKTLYEGLNKENAAQVLQLADLYRAETLKKSVMKYIVNHAPEVVKTTHWQETNWNPQLLLELFNQVVVPHATNDQESHSSNA